MRVLVGTPTFEYHRDCVDEFMAALEVQTEQRFDVILVDNSPTEDYVRELRAKRLPAFRTPFHPVMRERTMRARNLIREVFLRGDYSHLLFLDQDVILPPDGLAKLLAHDLPFVSGIYCKEFDGEEYAMVLMPDWRTRRNGIKVTPAVRLENKQGLVRIGGAGFGCLLIQRALVDGIELRYTEEVGNDLAFSEDVGRLGMDMFCDVSLRCGHRYVVRDFGRHPTWGSW